MIQTHPMVQAFKESPEKFLALIIWSLRKKLTNLAVKISNDDIGKMSLLPPFKVVIRGEHDAIEIQLVDSETGNMIAASADAALDNPAAVQMAKFIEMQARAVGIAERLESHLSGSLDQKAVSEAAEMLKFWGNERKF